MAECFLLNRIPVERAGGVLLPRLRVAAVAAAATARHAHLVPVEV